MASDDAGVWQGESLTGRLLISRPDMADPNFDGTLTLVLEHDEHGAIGIIINRLTGTTVDEAFPQWSGLVDEPSMIFHGGPVEPNAVIALGWGAALGGELGLGLTSIDVDDDMNLLISAGLERVRFFAGYAGWGEGQLDYELEVGAWWVVDATIDDVFTDDPERVWTMVLRRQGGELAWFAHLPADPSLN